MQYSVHFMIHALLLLSSPVSASKTEQIRIGQEDGYAEVHVLVSTKVKRSYPNRSYYWLKGTDLIITTGGWSGRLLHGPFISYYDNGQLKNQGELKHGLKSGEWREWDRSGNLIRITSFKNGLLHGYSSFNWSKVSGPDERHYRKGRLVHKRNKWARWPHLRWPGFRMLTGNDSLE